MPTGRTFTSTCSARASLAGNPSDGYGGAVVAIPIDDLCAVAAASESETFGVDAKDEDLRRLLGATAEEYESHHGSLPAVRLSASTTIPRSVGLAGSSALVIAALRALGAWDHHQWDPVELAETALAVERDRLDIAAGLQDRLVQAVDEPVAMTFDPVTHTVVPLPDGASFFIAWTTAATEPSDTVHRALRRRWQADDPLVRHGMSALAEEARRAARALADGDLETLMSAMNQTFDLRVAMIDITPRQKHLVELGRSHGAAVNSAGSGGSVVGVVSDERTLDELESVYLDGRAAFLRLD